MALAIALAMAKHSPVLFLPIYTGYILDTVIPAGDVQALWLCLAGMVAMIVANAAMHPLFIRLFSRARRQAAFALRARLCERLQQLVFAYLDGAQSGRLHSKVMQDVEKLDAFGQLLIDPLLIFAATAAAAGVVITWRHPEFLIVVAVALPVVFVQQLVLSRRVAEKHNRLRVEQEKLNAEVSEMIGMLPLSRAHATEEVELRRVSERLGHVRDMGVATDFTQHVLQSQIWGTSQIINILVIVVGAWLAIRGSMSVGELVMFLSFVGMTVGSIMGILSNLDKYYAAREAMRSILEVLGEPAIEENAGKRSAAPIDGRIEFRDVSFAYPGADRPALRGVSACVAPRQTIALVGPSGAGKTTFVKMLLGFYPASSGTVSIDGLDLAEADLRTIRRQVGIVTQETFLFNGTILQNLTHGLCGWTMADVEDAARRAHAHEFIAALEGGYETEIGDRGLKLSGGQKQRLAIARALLRKPRLLILDEATSALDSQSERVVQEALEALMQDRTTFVIAHRLSTVRRADRILVFHEGAIAEEGTHAELVAKGGLYARLVELQQLK